MEREDHGLRGDAHVLGRWARLMASLLVAGMVGSAQSSLAAEQPRVLMAWEFNEPGSLQGWRPNGHLQGVAVANGSLACAATGDDPILELVPTLDLPASARQFIEVRLEADRDGPAEIFWSNTTQGRYGGFSGAKATPFQVSGGEVRRTYRILPAWHPEGRIVRLRLDLFAGTRFKIDFIRILELPPAAPAARPVFDFQGGGAGWQTMDTPPLVSGANGLELRAAEGSSPVLSPPCRVDAASQNYVSLRLAASPGARARLVFMTAEQHGLHSLELPIISDGQERVHNVDMLQARDWKGAVVALGLQALGQPGAALRVRSLSAASEPQGPPQLRLVAFASGEALPRAGRPARVTALVVSDGGQPVGPLRASLEPPPGAAILSKPPPPSLNVRLAHGDEASLEWMLQVSQPLTNLLRLHIEAPGASPLVATTRLAISAAPAVAVLGRIPEPQPVRGPHEVGVYYFPGWNTDSRWHPIRRFPERKPALGWYREGDPEVAEWHIKWAVEHGITFFAYDWYWSAGARQLEHGLHQGYFQAPHRHLLKFCLLWANHNPPKTHSIEDSRAVARYWIEHYFRRPEYFRVQGRPLVIMFSPHNLVSDLGVEGTRQALEAMREECRRAGLPPVFVAACVGGVENLAAQGYDAVTAYNWPSLGVQNDERRAPYERLLSGYLQQWERLRDLSPVPVLLPVCGGWDSRPWHGESALVRHGRTPGLFQRHLLDARRLLDTGSARTNLLPAILVEAWNEWGEGSYIEPHQEFDFGYLDAIREVFTGAGAAHIDLTPADVGLGPYDVPRQAVPKPAWAFDSGLLGWDSTMHMAPLTNVQGALTGLTTGNDPAIFGPPMEAGATDYPQVMVRLRLTPLKGGAFKDQAQLFWSTRRWPESEASSWRFPVEGDGQWHDFRLPVAENRRWAGVITRLRLDPCSRAEVRVEMDSLRLTPASASRLDGGEPQ
jgi:hypothetical protein